jgi:hypothetical protein
VVRQRHGRVADARWEQLDQQRRDWAVHKRDVYDEQCEQHHRHHVIYLCGIGFGRVSVYNECLAQHLCEIDGRRINVFVTDLKNLKMKQEGYVFVEGTTGTK